MNDPSEFEALHQVGDKRGNGSVITSVEVTDEGDHLFETVHDSLGNSMAMMRWKPGSEGANMEELHRRLKAALVNNATWCKDVMHFNTVPIQFIDLQKQITMLTRQNSALIRLVLGLLDTTVGT